jgi:hypothetical protein
MARGVFSMKMGDYFPQVTIDHTSAMWLVLEPQKDKILFVQRGFET